MDTWMWAVLLKPFAAFVFMALIVAPISWFLFKLIPDGKLKIFLFRVRTGPDARPKDKRIMTIAVIIGYALLIGFAAIGAIFG